MGNKCQSKCTSGGGGFRSSCTQQESELRANETWVNELTREKGIDAGALAVALSEHPDQVLPQIGVPSSFSEAAASPIGYCSFREDEENGHGGVVGERQLPVQQRGDIVSPSMTKLRSNTGRAALGGPPPSGHEEEEKLLNGRSSSRSPFRINVLAGLVGGGACGFDGVNGPAARHESSTAQAKPGAAAAALLKSYGSPEVEQEGERQYLRRLFMEFVQAAKVGESRVVVVDPPGPDGLPYDAAYHLDGCLGVFTLRPVAEEKERAATAPPAHIFRLLHLETAWRASEFPSYWDTLRASHPTTLGRLPGIADAPGELDLASVCILDYSAAPEGRADSARKAARAGGACLPIAGSTGGTACQGPPEDDAGAERAEAALEQATRRLCLIEQDAALAERLVEAVTLLRLYNEDAGW